MGNIVDYSNEIMSDIKQAIEENGGNAESFFDGLDSYYSSQPDYVKGKTYLYVFYPDFDIMEDFCPIVMASCLQEAIDLFDSESEDAFSLDDWGIVKYPLIRGLII